MADEVKILQRLGPIPFWRGSEKCLKELTRIYRRAAECAERLELGDCREKGSFGIIRKDSRRVRDFP